MIALGLAFGEKLINAYAYDLKPSINKPATMEKIEKTFPEMSKYLIGKKKWTDEPAEFFNMTRRVDYQFWYDLITAEYESKFERGNFRKCTDDALYVGPLPKWQWKGRIPHPASLEVYLQVNTDDLQENPFRLYQIENGIGIDAGSAFPRGIPIKMTIQVDNDYTGWNNRNLLVLESALQFKMEGTWDDYWVYPQFLNFDLNDVVVNFDSVHLDHEEIGTRLQNLADWIRTDFNEWHALGVEMEDLNPSLRFMLGICRLTYMRPWQWVSYFGELIASIGPMLNLSSRISSLI